MKIYIVSHYYDNGESYEDYRDYETHFHFSTLEKANSFFWEKVVSDYEGKWMMVEKTLDTQEEKELETTPYLECHSAWYDCCPHDPDYEYEIDPFEKWADEHYWNGEPKYPERSIEDAWEFIDWLEDPDNPSIMKETSYLEEIEFERDWLSHEGTNYQEWKECEEEIKKKKSDILLDELNSMLVELLTIK